MSKKPILFSVILTQGRSGPGGSFVSGDPYEVSAAEGLRMLGAGQIQLPDTEALAKMTKIVADDLAASSGDAGAAALPNALEKASAAEVSASKARGKKAAADKAAADKAAADKAAADKAAADKAAADKAAADKAAADKAAADKAAADKAAADKAAADKAAADKGEG